MKIAVDIGHNCYPDIGASAIGNEDNMVLNEGKRLINKLIAAGNSVLLVTPTIAGTVDDSLAQRVARATAWGADLYISLHANSGGGKGVEIWLGSESSRQIGASILNEILKLGFKNRGEKVQGLDGHHLYVLNNTKMPSLLIETCFVDSSSDMALFNAEAAANAICAGITGKTVNRTGWDLENGIWYYYSNNVMAKNAWAQDSSSRWFYLGDTGAMITNGWAKDSSNRWFYLGADGAMITNAWAQDSHGWCYLGKDGAWDGITHQNKNN